MILGSWLNMLGAVLRFCVTPFGLDASRRYTVVMLGQTLGALAQPLIIFTPTKQAALWFPDHQRATANMIATMCEWFTALLRAGCRGVGEVSPCIWTSDVMI